MPIHRPARNSKGDVDDDFIAPDGGWGWFVAVSAGVLVLITLALSQQFGLIFLDHLPTLGITNSQITTIMNNQIAISAFTGLFNAPLFRSFTFRQVALASAVLSFLSHLLLISANSFRDFLLAYSVIFGLGRGLGLSSAGLAVNTYFKHKRRSAVSLQYGVAGLGSIIYPYLVTLLLNWSTVAGTMLILAGLSLHMVPSALILQPVLWHTKAHREDAGSLQPLEQFGHHKKRITTEKETCQANDQDNREFEEKTAVKNHRNVAENSTNHPLYKRIVVFFDLTLLCDISYINLVVGLILMNFVEQNFAILTPFILFDFGYSTRQIAASMTLLGLCDLITRFLIPVITSHINGVTNKYFFMIGITGMCFGRILLMWTNEFHVLLAVMLWIGLSKAFRTVFWGLIMPSFVPLKRLPAATGLELMLSGCFSMAMGPFIGLLRDNTNYKYLLNVMNAVSVFAMALWILEDSFRKCSRRPV